MLTIDQKVDELTTRVGNLLDLTVGSIGLFGSSAVAATPRAPKRIGTPVWSATMILDWAQYDIYRITLGGNTTFSFTGSPDGASCIVELKQDTAGSHTITLPADVRFPADIPTIALTTTANAMDRLGFIYNGASARYDLSALVKGFA